MDFPVISEQTLAFSDGWLERENSDFVRKAPASLEQLLNFGTQIKICEERGDSSGSDCTVGGRGKLDLDLDKSLTVQINNYSPTVLGCLTVWTTKSNADCYEQLKKASGGQLLLNMKLELGTSTGNDKMIVNVENAEMFRGNGWDVSDPTGLVFLLSRRFDFTESLSRAWRDNGNTFTGKLSVNLELDDNHLGGILRSGEEQNPLLPVNKRMKMDEKFTDATLVPGKGEGIKCHKLVLIANSEFFEKIFETKMKEGLTGTVEIPDMTSEGVQALLDFLYCRDTIKASTSAFLAMELLMKAEEYAIESLEKAMLQLIDSKGNDWFPVGVAIQLLQFAKKKFENEGLFIYQLVRRKAAVVFKSKSKKEVEECPEFIEVFQNAKDGAKLFTYFMFSV